MAASSRVVLTAMVVAIASPAFAGEYTSLGPVVMTARDAAIPRDGGVLVGCCVVTYKDDHDRDPTIQRGWRFRSGRRTSRPAIQTLAPGLSVYRPARRGDVVLVDDEGSELGAFHDGAGVSRFAVEAPRIVHISVEGNTTLPEDWIIDGEISIPTDAVAVIVYAVDRRGRTAIDWRPLQAHGLSGRRAKGSRLPRVGERVELRWVDAFGRRSPASKVVEVGQVFTCRDESCYPGRYREPPAPPP